MLNQMHEEDSICLDPSCFVSLEKLRDMKHFLNEIKDNPFFKVYVPSEVYETINLSPEEKFRKLPPLIADWIIKDEKENIKSIDRETKEDYVYVMREFFNLHKPRPATELIKNITKIGKESLYLDDLIKKFGKRSGKILFEIAAISSEYHAKILAFGEKTISFFRDVGTRIVKGTSTVKKNIKERARIRTPINIMMYFFVPAKTIYEFIDYYQIHGVDAFISTAIVPIALPAGWLLIGNT